MIKKAHILIVEDDLHAGSLLQDLLKGEGFDTDLCPNAEKSLDLIKTNKYDLFILDCMLPGRDGFSLAKLIRIQDERVPLIFLTAKSLKEDLKQGFKSGADDYITKPFDTDELLLRVKAILRRHNGNLKKEGLKRIGNYQFDHRNQSLSINGKMRRITKRESNIINTLCENLGELVNKEEILIRFWGHADYFTGRSLDVFIAKLRKYLSEDPNIEIENVHGVGYVLKIKDEKESNG